MFALFCFFLSVLAAPFKSKSRLEAENAVLRHQLIVLRLKVPGRVRLTNNDRWFLMRIVLAVVCLMSCADIAMAQNQSENPTAASERNGRALPVCIST